MELRFIPKGYSEELSNLGLEGIPKEYLDSIFKDFEDEIVSRKYFELNYGPGADWIWIYVILQGITNLIILGGEINSGFEGWQKLGQKFKKLINKSSHIALDKDAITVLCVSKILELNPGTTLLKKVIEYEIEIPLGNGTLQKGEISDFIEKAEVYYVQGFEVDRDGFILFGSKMNGVMEVLKKVNM